MTSSFAGVLDPQGPAARQIDGLWVLMLVVGTAVFVLVAALLVIGLVRKGSEGDPDGTSQSRSWLYGGGVLLPVAGVLVVLVATLAVMRDTDDIGASTVAVEVIGHQWWWEFRYPDADVTSATELHIPAGEPVELRITSTDVIHSFWVPSLAGKRDAIPEDVTTLVIEADEPGRYAGKCAEFCGLQHAYMDLTVVAHTAEDYTAWLDDQAEVAAEPAGGEAARGADLFVSAGCGECHTVRGTRAAGDDAPELTHLMSRRLMAGGRLETTPEDLRRWLHDPDELKNGVDMPPADLPAEDVDAIVAYLETLE